MAKGSGGGGGASSGRTTVRSANRPGAAAERRNQAAAQIVEPLKPAQAEAENAEIRGLRAELRVVQAEATATLQALKFNPETASNADWTNFDNQTLAALEKVDDVQARLHAAHEKIETPAQRAARMAYLKEAERQEKEHPPLGQTLAEQTAFAQRSFGGWQESLSQGERDAFSKYTTAYYYKRLNGSLRKETALPADTKSVQEGLLKALARPAARTPRAMTVYRSTGIPKLYEEFAKRGTLDGFSFHDKGWGSTSVDKAYAEKWYGSTKIKLLLPKGTPAMYASNGLSSAGSMERELLLGPGMKYVVVQSKVRKGGQQGKPVLEVTMRAYAPNHPHYASIETTWS